MPDPKIFTTRPSLIRADNFNPRNYDPVFLFVRSGLKKCPDLRSMLLGDVTSGSTPPSWLFRKRYEGGVPYVKTSAILRDFINLNDLHFIHQGFHQCELKRSITKPYDVVFSMTGKFMGKAALCPPQIRELNMTQNSVVLRCNSHEEAAFVCIYLNSTINQTQIRGTYSITKQKYLNQDSIRQLKIIDYAEGFEKDAHSYVESLKAYYDAVISIQRTISKFDQFVSISEKTFDSSVDFKIRIGSLDTRILTPMHYRKDFLEAISKFDEDKQAKKLADTPKRKGDEIGSSNYLFEGIPFIKTSDYINFGVDYQPDYYCSVALYEELGQNLQKGDILFTKDGKIGQTAILEESARIVYSSGSIRLRPSSEEEGYWLFLLLSSVYGRIFFERWTVIASTMAHLQKDFFEDFRIPKIDQDVKSQLISELKAAFQMKREAFEGVEASKKSILQGLESVIKV
ncbi:MAG: restriction endonuclease subunit S [archaeon]|nr:restriction endonuclease subunit S [archaeon]